MMTASASNPLTPFLANDGVMLLDGGLATELERRGAELHDNLWSAKLLLENPSLIQQVHAAYFAAGADVAITASYQATFPGFAQRGIDETTAARLMLLSVELACTARDLFWAFYVDEHHQGKPSGRQRPLVAASIGPYGAYLADGSEYRGDYGLSVEELMDFHRPRLQVLAGSEADLFACETIPTLVEAEALVRLLAEFPHKVAWLSFSCGDERHLWHGETFAEAVELANRSPQIVAVGVNCTAPRLVEPLLRSVHDANDCTDTCKPLLVYPNRGEAWDSTHMCWVGGSGETDFAEPVRHWYAAGARLIGGCCRTTPEDIRMMAAVLRGR